MKKAGNSIHSSHKWFSEICNRSGVPSGSTFFVHVWPANTEGAIQKYLCVWCSSLSILGVIFCVCIISEEALTELLTHKAGHGWNPNSKYGERVVEPDTRPLVLRYLCVCRPD